MKSADLILSILNRLVDIGERAYGMAVVAILLAVMQGAIIWATWRKLKYMNERYEKEIGWLKQDIRNLQEDRKP